MPHYAIQMADGSVAIMQTVGNAKPEACVAKWPDQSGIVSIKEIQPADIPQDRTYRDAWVLNGDKIEHDQDKVAAIQLERDIAAAVAEADAQVMADKRAAALDTINAAKMMVKADA